MEQLINKKSRAMLRNKFRDEVWLKHRKMQRKAGQKQVQSMHTRNQHYCGMLRNLVLIIIVITNLQDSPHFVAAKCQHQAASENVDDNDSGIQMRMPRNGLGVNQKTNDNYNNNNVNLSISNGRFTMNELATIADSLNSLHNSKDSQSAQAEIGGHSMMTPDRRNDDQSEQPLHQLQLPLQLHLKLRPLPLPLPPPPPTQTSSPASGAKEELRESGSQIPKAPASTTTTTTERPTRKAPRSIASGNTLQTTTRLELSGHQDELIASTEQGRDSATWREAKRVLLLNSNPTVAQRLDKRTLPSPQDSLTLETRPSFSRVDAANSQHQQLQTHQLAQSQRNEQPQQDTINNGNQEQKQRERLEALSAALLPLIWPLRATAGDASRPYAEASATERAIRVVEPPESQQQPRSHSDKQLSRLVELNLAPPSEPRQPRRKRKKTPPAYLQQASSSTTPYPDSFRMASKYPMPKIKYSQQQQAVVANQVQQNSARAITSKRLVAKQQHQMQHQKNKLAKQNKKVNYQPFESPAENASTSANKQMTSSTRVSPEADSPPTPSWQLSSLPKGLSKFIEDKLFQNVTNFLMQRMNSGNKTHSQAPGLVKLNAPTTSVSRVVNVIGSARKLVGASMELNEAAKAQSPERLAEAALTIANAASDAWRQSNLTLEDLRSMVNSNSNTTPKPLSTSPSTSTVEPQPTTTLAPQLKASDATQNSSLENVTLNVQQAQPTTTSTSTTTEPPMTSERVSGVQYQKQHDNQDQEQVVRQRVAQPVASEPESDVESSEKDKPELDFVSERGKNNNLKVTSKNDTEKNAKKTYKRRDFSASQKNKQQQQNLALIGSSTNNNNIKLFHFKRKPDVNKLPFYKKPLNYTELGWSAEQIQEHQDYLASLGLAGAQPSDSANQQPNQNNNNNSQPASLGAEPAEGINNSVAASNANSENGGAGESIIELETRDQQAQLQSQQMRDREDQQQDKFHLLKRKRRGGRTSQFDRLMADLHSQSQSQSQSQLIEANQANNANHQEAANLQLESASNLQQQQLKSNELVPTLRKKEELLIMKPIFMMHAMLNQSRTSTTTTTTTTQKPGQQDDKPSSKPIVRMRRKNAQHHEQARPPANGWKPISSSNDQTGLSVSVSEQLMLVPSGLLTPSGSHLIPLIAKAPEQQHHIDTEQNHKLLSQFFSWKPARNQNTQQEQPFTMLELDVPASLINGRIENLQQQQDQSMQPVNIVVKAATQAGQGAAASGEPASAKAATSNGEFRVPKLLVKPLRPAKYSLNGYIPKPSLNHASGANSNGEINNNNQQQQQQQQHQQLATLKSQQPLNPNWTSSQSKQQTTTRTQQQAGFLSNQNTNNNNNNNRDLDSSTSNEIFSRRRGLNPTAAETSGGIGADQANLLQHRAKLEENKRKYMLLSSQQEHKNKRSPTLSAHKANLIRAKLGLVPKPANNNISSSINAEQQQQQQASTNSISHLNPSASHSNRFTTLAAATAAQQVGAANGESDENGAIVAQQQAAVGASPSSASGIPKTDFECADAQGKFVSGLFADYKTKCQVWHLCSNNRKYSFLCPAGTVFNSKSRICDWRYNVKCDAESTLPRYQAANNNNNNEND